MKLYHYTTIDTLAHILKNKTLRFNCLCNVDDQEEAETSDFGSFKEHIFVSCWTDDSSENIALWNMYAKNMKGIRIGIDSIKIQFCPKENVQIPLYHLVKNVIPQNDNSAFIIWLDENKKGEIDPKIKVRYDMEGKYQFESKKSDIRTHYNFEDLACRKRKEWAFQNEIRYVLFGASIDNTQKIYDYQYVITSIIEKKTMVCDYVDLQLNDDFFEKIEILLGPSTCGNDKFICESLLDKYIGNNQYELKKSQLKIKSRRKGD